MKIESSNQQSFGYAFNLPKSFSKECFNIFGDTPLVDKTSETNSTDISTDKIEDTEVAEIIAEEIIKKNEENSISNIYTDSDVVDDIDSEKDIISINASPTGCVVTSVNSQPVNSSPLVYLSDNDISKMRENAYSTTIHGSDDVIKGGINEALSTQNVHNCACLVLYNEEEGTQVLYHVFAGTQNSDTIADVIQEVMPEGFSRAVIVPGDNLSTVNTVELIYGAITDNYPEAEIGFMHSTIENPVIISYNGQMYQAESPEEGTLFPEGTNLNPNEPPYTILPEDAEIQECSKNKEKSVIIG